MKDLVNMDVTEKFKNLIEAHKVAFDKESLKTFSINGMLPVCVIRPKTGKELAQWLRAANKHGAKVHLWGNGSHQHLGGICNGADIAVALDHMNQLIEYNPEDCTATVQCGMTLANLQKVLAEHKLYLPLDPPLSQQATIGGIVASNVYGPRSHRFGTARDMVIGIKAVLADGTEIKAGGKTVKNVAGYDLCKLFIGSMGTLGAITEITFKLWPLSEISQTLTAYFDTMENAEAAVKELFHSQLSISGLVYLNHSAMKSGNTVSASSHNLLVLLDDSERVIKTTIDNINQVVRGKMETLNVAEDQTQPPSILDAIFGRSLEPDQNCLILRAILPKSKVFEFLREAEQSSFDAISYCGRGIVYLMSNSATITNIPVLVDLIKKLRAQAQQMGGALVLEKSPQEAKTQIDVWGLEENHVEWMRKIKKEFDPNGVFASGRFVGGI